MNTYTNGLIVVVTLCGIPPLTSKKLSPGLWNSSSFVILLLNSGAARPINDTGYMVVKQVALLLCKRATAANRGFDSCELAGTIWND